MRRFLFALAVALVIAAPPIALAPHALEAQVTNAVAFCTFSTLQLLGPVTPNQAGTGWDWQLFCALNANTGNKDIAVVNAGTLSGDTLGAIGQKLANAVKAEAANRNFNVTLVLLPSSSLVTPQ